MTDVVVVRPRRRDHGHRDRLADWSLAWWEHHLEPLGWPIIDGHHDEGRFNRSAAVNAAAAEAGSWDVLVILDGDVVVRRLEQVTRAVELAERHGRMTFAHDQWVGLDQRGTEAIMSAGPLGPGYNWKRHVQQANRMTFSCCQAIPRTLWRGLGGMDERFRGWGCEDGAFHVAARLLGEGTDRVSGELFHLWHPRSEEREHGHPDYRANFELRDRYEAVRDDPAGMLALLSEPGAPLKVPA